MDLHQGETVLFEGHPSWRSTLLFFTKGLAAAAVLGVIVGLIDSSWVLGVIVGGVGLAITIGVGLLLRQATVYMITDERLHIRRGLIARKVQETRLGRVQNVTVTQSVWERLLQIGSAEFDTASEDQNHFVFAGIQRPDQVRLAVDEAHRLAEGRGPVPPAGGTIDPGL